MTNDFNIRNNDWNLSYFYYSSYIDTLLKIANSLELDLSTPINPSFTQFLNNFQDSNSVLNLMFLRTGSEQFNNHLISPDLQSLLDHVPLLVPIIIEEKSIQEKKEFINKLRCRIGFMEMTDITNYKELECVTQEFASTIEDLWNKSFKLINITKKSKSWQNKEYNRDLATYYMFKSRTD